MAHHLDGALGPPQEQQMGQAAQAAEHKADDEGGRNMVNRAHQPSAPGNADKEMADDEEQTPTLPPLTLRPEVGAKVRNQLIVTLAAHFRLTVQDNRRWDWCRLPDAR